MKKYVLPTLVISSLFFCCNSNKEGKPVSDIRKTVGTTITDSLAPPVITGIPKAKPPKYVKAAPPTIVPLKTPSGVGIPIITNYGTAEGLPGSFASPAGTDQQGNLWFSTRNSGIFKYDGRSFTNYNDDIGITSNSISYLFIDSKNNLWIKTGEDLIIFNGKYFTRPLIDKKPLKAFVLNIVEDRSGTIWIAADGLFKYKDNVFTRYTTADGLADMFVRTVIQDENDDILVSTLNGVNRYDGQKFVPYLSIPHNKDGIAPTLRYCDTKGNIWFSDRLGGLGKYDGTQIKIYTEEDGFSNRWGQASALNPNFTEDKNGNLWIGGNGGVTRFDGKSFVTYTEKAGLASTNVVSVSEDAYGNIWVGTRDNGVSKIGNADLLELERPSVFIEDVTFDKSNNVWVFTSEGIGKYNPDHIAYYGKELVEGKFAKTWIDYADNVWFSVHDFDKPIANLVKFDGTGYTIYGKEQGLPLDRITRIIQDEANNFWLMGGGRVVKFDGSSFTSYDSAQGFKGGFIYSSFVDSKNNIWIGCDNGLWKFDGKYFTNYTTLDGLPAEEVRNITEDGLGNIWLATTVGASKFDGNKFFNFRAKDGLSNYVSDVGYDPFNKLIWFTTDLGLASLELDQTKEEMPYFQHYNPRTGFEFPGIWDFVIDKLGIVWARDGRVFRFDYNGISNSKPIPLQIRNIRLNNKNISWNTLRKGGYPDSPSDSLAAINEIGSKFGKAFTGEDFQEMDDAFGKVSYDSVVGSHFLPVNLVLPFKNNTISFEFGSISTSFGKGIQYQYKLEGYDKGWSELTNKTEVSFGNMNEGNYTFQVKALSPFGTWSEASYSFTVLPPSYRTWWAYALYVMLFVSGVGLFIRWRTKALQKEKVELEEKVNTRTSELKESLENLKATQSQLIQSEKMASLGELTAGIAHEIQNPLNFVNNFSELSVDLAKELKEEAEKAEIDKELIIDLATDLSQNQEKINHHGKRASDIVKGMLEHSRKSTGEKELTDINALCDEYLRLAYHGLKAKDNGLNSTMETDFDKSIGKVNIIPQDIGRVILNLINNAFYVVNEKSKQNIAGYEPTVSVSTKKEGNKVLISIRDNGNGIPQKIVDKIFQPFFTTKPTGQGTGLGLSLSYDIVKAHGGEIKVASKENEGTEFTIQLTIS